MATLSPERQAGNTKLVTAEVSQVKVLDVKAHGALGSHFLMRDVFDFKMNTYMRPQKALYLPKELNPVITSGKSRIWMTKRDNANCRSTKNVIGAWS